MSNNKLKGAARARGYCCIFAAIRSNRAMNTAATARFFLVSRDTIQYWKAKIKLKECKCTHSEGCMKRLRGGIG